MGWDDPVSDAQVRFIRSLRDQVMGVDSDEEYFDRMVRAVYDCGVEELNRGQASMLIDDLKWEMGEGDEEPDYQSVFGRAA